MWRAFFLAIGICCCAVGAECLVVEQANVVASADSAPAGPYGRAQSPTRPITPPEWAPWSLLAGGAVVMIYSFTIPTRLKG
jgi:hypothetical protein